MKIGVMFCSQGWLACGPAGSLKAEMKCQQIRRAGSLLGSRARKHNEWWFASIAHIHEKWKWLLNLSGTQAVSLANDTDCYHSCWTFSSFSAGQGGDFLNFNLVTLQLNKVAKETSGRGKLIICIYLLLFSS